MVKNLKNFKLELSLSKMRVKTSKLIFLLHFVKIRDKNLDLKKNLIKSCSRFTIKNIKNIKILKIFPV